MAGNVALPGVTISSEEVTTLNGYKVGNPPDIGAYEYV